jgi:hypothetical protein
MAPDVAPAGETRFRSQELRREIFRKKVGDLGT